MKKNTYLMLIIGVLIILICFNLNFNKTADNNINKDIKKYDDIKNINESEYSAENIIFHDSIVEARVRELLNKESGIITNDDIEKLKDFKTLLIPRECTDIQDVIKYFPNIENLKIESVYESAYNYDLISYLKNLKRLEIGNKNNKKDNNDEFILNIDGISKIKNIKYLIIENNKVYISKPELFSNLKNLEKLDCSQIIQFDYNVLKYIPNLKEVKFNFLEKANNLNDIIGMKNIDNITISFNYQEKLENINTLKYLNINENDTFHGYKIMKNDNFRYEIFGINFENKKYIKTLIFNEKNNSDEPFQILNYELNMDDLQYEIYYKFDNRIKITDVNFDGYSDFLILDELIFNKSYPYYICFLWNNEKNKYIENESFKEILNPGIDTENNKIISHSYEFGMDEDFFSIFEYSNNEFIEIGFLSIRMNSFKEEGKTIYCYRDERLNNGKIEIYKEFLYSDLITPLNEKECELFESGSFWDLNSQRWKNLINFNDSNYVSYC